MSRARVLQKRKMDKTGPENMLKRRQIRANVESDASLAVQDEAQEGSAVAKQLFQCSLSLHEKIRSAAQSVFNALGTGFSESVYRDALVVALEATQHVRVQSDREVILPIHYANRYVGFCRSDIVLLCTEEPPNKEKGLDNTANSAVVIELKAVSGRLSVANVQQLSAYMRLLNASSGILINFAQGIDPRVRAALKDKCTVVAPSEHVEPVECLFVQKK